jgi:hypothetical protein
MARCARQSKTYLDPVDGFRRHNTRTGEMPETHFCIFDRDSECEPPTRIVPQNVRAVVEDLCRILGDANIRK